MSGTSDNERGPVTILDQLRAAERRVAELEAQLASTREDLAPEQRSSENRQQELDIERTNGKSLHQALDSLQTQHRRLLNDQDERTGVSNRRLAEQLRQMLEASQESNADLLLEGRYGEVTRLDAENLRLTQQVEDLKSQLQSTNDQLSTQMAKAAEQEGELVKVKEECKAEVDEMKRKTRELEDRIGTEESRTADAVADSTRAAVAEINELRNRLQQREEQLKNSEQALNDLLEQHHSVSPISIIEAGFVRLFNFFLKGKHLTADAHVEEQIDTFMHDFYIPAELVQPLRRQLVDEAHRVRNDRRPPQREQQ